MYGADAAADLRAEATGVGAADLPGEATDAGVAERGVGETDR